MVSQNTSSDLGSKAETKPQSILGSVQGDRKKGGMMQKEPKIIEDTFSVPSAVKSFRAHMDTLVHKTLHSYHMHCILKSWIKKRDVEPDHIKVLRVRNRVSLIVLTVKLILDA